MGMTTPARNPALSLPAIDAAIRAIRQEYPELRRTPFTNLVTNGGFDTDTAWTKGTGWTIAAGVATKTAGTGSALEQTTLKGVVGRRYLKTETATMTAALVNSTVLGVATANRTTSGTYSDGITAISASGIQYFGSAAFAGSIDNVSLWEADPADDAPWLRLPYGHRVMQGDQMHPLASVQRDADMLHAVDFTEIWRNGQAFIKPASAPGVSTRFSVVSYKAI